jgi:hypothetical protein
MDELVILNRRIAAHWLGFLDADHEAYLSYATVCLGQFTYRAAELAEFLARPEQKHRNALPVARLNRQYLRFARLAAKDVAAGKLEMLIRLCITLEEAEALANLTNNQLNRLAFGWDGPIIRFASHAFNRGVALHVEAAQHHATAFITTHFST